ncbi:MAG: alpha/beta fold hydrolase [Deltaproteobacteria bacterium]|nr:alpha/beta fold hydrolase [Candidatus Tharpella aukensis]
MNNGQNITQTVDASKVGRRRIFTRQVLKTMAALLAIFALACFFSFEQSDATDEIIQKVLLVLLLSGLGLVLIRLYSIFMGFRQIRKVIGTQNSDAVTFILDKCKPLHRSFHEKKEHVVILLHGFISSPMIFDELIKELDENEVDYQAPLIYGFGVNRIQLLFTLSEDEWVRQVTELYDVLDTQYKNISVIGHSLGGLLALYLSQIRPVKHLILAAPAIFPSNTQKIHRYLAKSVFLAKVIPWIIPLLPMKKQKNRSGAVDVLDEQAAKKYYLYPVAPTRGVFNILRLQSKLDLKKANYQTLDLFYGTQDLAVDGEKVWEYLQKNNLLHRVHRFDHTGHNPFIDNDKELTGWIVIYILNDELQWPPVGQRYSRLQPGTGS